MNTTDQAEIRQLVENWAVWRDAGHWDQFATLWHPDGVMQATWFQGGYRDFIEVSRQGWERGVRIWHFLGGTSVEVAGHRAIGQTKMTITQRAVVEGVECDVVCTGRFYDFLERGDGWKLVLRQPVYERDRIDPVDPGANLRLDQDLLKSLPDGYRHLAYLQTGLGYQVKTDMPQLTGAAVEALYQRGRAWLRDGR
ncbi:nuclear transport factor 2 family protein [Nonomuraea sp. NEAU-A123]|uniref:nuclear transport factor 2 family protein n=1 Tax=Nonomuraea sp. NEAU-A123 TaxID=2839649 RepID=UPI001BE47F79|nr:nuclear transport factor 2 family protein [Nonomuraea sp. NEAU-A123]MBT2234204.1 nuclear transport factor 2 family protein [Nonomuraea sp. NEAU-A123]